ncbi:MAG: GvpL/GvpF family gas vesicle protein [Pseudomonadota bacterium]
MALNYYVYGVMRAADLMSDRALSFRPVVDADAPIELIACGGLRAVVSEIEATEILSTRRNLLGHAKALEALMAVGPVLPMRFGVIAPTQAQIAQAVELKLEALQDHLAAFDGCAEYAVRIAWRREAAMRELVAENAALKTAHDRLRGRSAAETHFERLDLGRAVEAALLAKRAAEAATYLDRLGPLSRAVEAREPEEDIQVLKADFLVETDAVGAFSAALEAIEAEAPGRLAVKLVGPSPAYSFTKLSLGWGAAPASVGGGGEGAASWAS